MVNAVAIGDRFDANLNFVAISMARKGAALAESGIALNIVCYTLIPVLIDVSFTICNSGTFQLAFKW